MRMRSRCLVSSFSIVLTVFGVLAGTVMVVSYGLESKGAFWVAAFAVGCLGAALYGALTGAWVFVVLELVWAGLATRRFTLLRADQASTATGLH